MEIVNRLFPRTFVDAEHAISQRVPISGKHTATLYALSVAFFASGIYLTSTAHHIPSLATRAIILVSGIALSQVGILFGVETSHYGYLNRGPKTHHE